MREIIDEFDEETFCMISEDSMIELQEHFKIYTNKEDEI